MTLPPIARVRQVHRHPEVADVPGAVADATRSSRIRDRVRPGGLVATTVGSRRVGGIAAIARSAQQRPGDRAGRADDRLVAAIGPKPMRVNSLTSNFPARARVPLGRPTDRAVLAACLDTCWRVDPAEARMVLIPNTLELTHLWVTGPLLREAAAHPGLAVESELGTIPLDFAGTLDQEGLFPRSVRGRRAAGVSHA